MSWRNAMVPAPLSRLAALAFVLAAGAAQAQAPAADPASTYQKSCGDCHGGGFGPPVLGKGLAADKVAAVVRSGRGAMPAFSATEIGEVDLAALADWIAKSKADAPPTSK